MFFLFYAFFGAEMRIGRDFNGRQSITGILISYFLFLLCFLPFTIDNKTINI